MESPRGAGRPTDGAGTGEGAGGPVLFWFRRDLRLTDHPALAAAVDDARERGVEVIPFFVVDPELLASAGVYRRAFLADCLAALRESLGGHLVLRRGRAGDVVPALAREAGASLVVATGDCAPFGRARDRGVIEALEADGRALMRISSPYAVAPGRVLSGSGTPYRVFTPFKKAWLAHGWPAPAPGVTGPWGSLASDQDVSDVAPVRPEPEFHRPAGEAGAAAALDRFLADAVEGYGDDRNRPDLDGTSQLSPHLRFGTIHPRQILARLGSGQGADTFRSEIAWREFYADVLWHQPDSAYRSLHAVGEYLHWDSGPEADARFAAWCEGRTGVPMVDAGMRQLLQEGWMHNRVRMLAASYLVKDLHVDWRRGARHFMTHLADADVASNQHGWQWVAGTGTDAAPFYRIFNPDIQAARFDPDGNYVRRYVPEVGTPEYPPPLVDHSLERHEALARWEAAKVLSEAAGSGPSPGPDRSGS